MANVVPIFAVKIPGLSKLNAPMDCGLKFRGKRILGDHKTWRGLVCGLIFSTLTLWLQQLAVRHFGWAQTLTIKSLSPAYSILVRQQHWAATP
jgi:hypothetical protein